VPSIDAYILPAAGHDMNPMLKRAALLRRRARLAQGDGGPYDSRRPRSAGGAARISASAVNVISVTIAESRNPFGLPSIANPTSRHDPIARS
jgi:hypothetical protein